jgi:hypothetical protein
LEIENGVIMGGDALCMSCSMTPDRMAKAINAMAKQMQAGTQQIKGLKPCE